MYRDQPMDHFLLDLLAQFGGILGTLLDQQTDKLVELLFGDGLTIYGCNLLGLQGQGQLADLVEEDGAAVRLFEAAHPGHHRAGEGAFLVTEQFALQQVFRQGGAVHLDERPVAP